MLKIYKLATIKFMSTMSPLLFKRGIFEVFELTKQRQTKQHFKRLRARLRGCSYYIFVSTKMKFQFNKRNLITRKRCVKFKFGTRIRKLCESVIYEIISQKYFFECFSNLSTSSFSSINYLVLIKLVPIKFHFER